MNPEFRRNLWLELTPRRVVFMVAILGLIFFAAGISGVYSPGAAARVIYYFIVVFWGARNAGLSVVGEIRDHTWDGQRLSSISALQMTWGKLLGSTIYNWFGGVICLVVIAVQGFATQQSPVSVILDLLYLVTAGLIAQSASLLASLIAVRRRQKHSGLEVFVYQMIGVIAAIGVFYIWEAADPASAILLGRKATDFIGWWGVTLDARPFLLLSLAVFAGWILTGCYREMRRELKLRNGPLVWLGFLAFIGLYVAGFDAWLSQDKDTAQWSSVALRLALAAMAYGLLTYLMVFLEPKDRVLYRWYGKQIGSGRIGLALASLQAWIMSFFATVTVTVALIAWLWVHGQTGDTLAIVISTLGFLTRDVAIFVLFATLPGRRRGDFAVLATLLALYVLFPAIIGGLGLPGAMAFFRPALTTPVWLGGVIGWVEAAAVLALAITRLALGEKSEA
jgi:hypothetical protein